MDYVNTLKMYRVSSLSRRSEYISVVNGRFSSTFECFTVDLSFLALRTRKSLIRAHRQSWYMVYEMRSLEGFHAGSCQG